MDTSTLKSAYEALRDFLAENNLYEEAATADFDRGHLADLLTAYYDAEGDIVRAAASAKVNTTANATLDDIARKLGYANGYADMVLAAQDPDKKKTLIAGGFINTDLIKADKLVCGGLALTNAGSHSISIKPEEGLRLYEREEPTAAATRALGEGVDQSQMNLTASFSGQRIDSLSSIVPNSAHIPVREVLAENIPFTASQKILMGSGTVNGSKNTPISVTIPAFSAMVKMDYVALDPLQPGEELKPGIDRPLPDDPWKPTNGHIGPVTLRAELLINNEVKTAAECVIDSYHLTCKFEGIDLNGKPISTRYKEAHVYNRADFAGHTYTVTTANHPIKIEFRYVVTTLDPFLFNAEWQLKAAIRKPNTTIDSKPLVSDLIFVGGETLNAMFYGNGVLFSKRTDQYAGLAASNSKGAELIVRSENQGFRADSTGQWRWSKRRQEWIPADSVLFRGYSPAGGLDNLRTWSYNGKPLAVSVLKHGSVTVVFPEKTFTTKGDYFVRASATSGAWQGAPVIFAEGLTQNQFYLTTLGGEFCAWQGGYFEVVYLGDWWEPVA